MKTVELKQLSIENYKKFESAEYQFAPRTMAFGRNRQGKSTLMDAYFDTLTGKLADGTSPNSVRRKENGEEIEGIVARELTLLIDGEETVIRKETKKSSTKYHVGVHKDWSKTRFKEYLIGKIADPEKISMCSNAKVFLRLIQKSTSEAREKLGKMAGFDTDRFIQDYPEISKITDGESVETTMKDINKDKKDIQKKIDAKKVEIDTVKKQEMPDATVLEGKRGEILDKLNEIDQKVQQLSDSSKSYDELAYEITGLKKSRDAIVSTATEALQDKKRKIVSLLNTKQIDKMKEESQLRDLENELAKTDNPKRIKQVIIQLRGKYKAQYEAKYDNSSKLEEIQNEEFDPTVAICPTCGQNLPEEQVERLKTEFDQKKQERIKVELAKKEQFEADKQQKLRDINEEGQAEVNRKKEVEEKRKDIESQIDQTKKSIATLASEIAQKNQELEKLPSEPDMSGNEEYQAVMAEIQKKQEQIDGLTNNSEEKAAVQAERVLIEKELTGIEKEIEIANQTIQKQAEALEQLNTEQKELGQKHSDIQQKLDMLKEFSIKKNQKLAEAINSHFKHFQFQFLDYTQDGEPVEVCKMICDGIGYFDGLNHSDQILCNIDLVTGLQELNGLNLPIWVDDVESVNADRIPDTGRQMILLKVSDDELKVEGI